MMEFIISTDQNQHIKRLKSLQQKKRRETEERFLVEGIRFAEEALASDSLESVFVTPQALKNERVAVFLQSCEQKEIQIFQVEERVLNKVTETVNSQGVIGVGIQPVWQMEDLFAGETIVLFVDGIQDPGNLGTILRTCQGAGIGGVIISKGTVDLYNSKVLRATMGAIFKLPIYKWKGNRELFDDFKRKGFQIVAADIESEVNYYNVILDYPTLLVIGNEANGPSEGILQMVDFKAKLPMPGNFESLNVAVATGIMLFEALRQRQCRS